MTLCPPGSVPYEQLPVGPYLVLDRDDMVNYAESGGAAVHWCMCERVEAHAENNARLADQFVVDWRAMPNRGNGAVVGWEGDRWNCFPIDSVLADQMFMKAVHGAGDTLRWSRLCDAATGVLTV